MSKKRKETALAEQMNAHSTACIQQLEIYMFGWELLTSKSVTFKCFMFRR